MVDYMSCISVNYLAVCTGKFSMPWLLNLCCETLCSLIGGSWCWEEYPTSIFRTEMCTFKMIILTETSHEKYSHVSANVTFLSKHYCVSANVHLSLPFHFSTLTKDKFSPREKHPPAVVHLMDWFLSWSPNPWVPWPLSSQPSWYNSLTCMLQPWRWRQHIPLQCLYHQWHYTVISPGDSSLNCVYIYGFKTCLTSTTVFIWNCNLQL